MRGLLELLTSLVASGEDGVMATVVSTSGSTPQQPGARMLLRADGTLVGTVGGGAVEAAIIEAMRHCLVEGRPRLVEQDLGQDLGMCCGGRMSIFVEPIQQAPRLVIFGAGHVGQATAPIAAAAGFAVTVVDDREDLNTAERFPSATRLLAEPQEAATELAITERDWLLIATHDHPLDEEALDHYARGPHRYIGMIASKRKVFRILGRIASRGPLPNLDKVYAPVGLPLGGASPGEIAISVVAELVALRRGQTVPHLRAVDDPRLARVLGRNSALTAEDAARLPE